MSIETDDPTALHVLYRIYDKDDVLLYVGITLSPTARLSLHSHEKNWWRNVATIRLEHLPNRVALLNAERDAVNTERPLHNVVHSRIPKPERELTAEESAQIGAETEGGEPR